MGEVEILTGEKKRNDETLERIERYINGIYGVKASSETPWKFVCHGAYYDMDEVNREIAKITEKYGVPPKEDLDFGDSCIDDAFPGYLLYSYRFLYRGEKPHLHVVTYVSKL